MAEVEVYGTSLSPVRTFVNTGFESFGPPAAAMQFIGEALVPGWSTTEGIADLRNSVNYEYRSPSPDGTNGGRIELWGSGYFSVPSFEGGRHAELNAFMNGELSQEPICVLPGERFNWSLAHRGRNGVDVMRLRIDNVDVAEIIDNNAQTGTHTVSVLTPATTTATKGATNAAGWTQYSGTWTNTTGASKIVQFAFRAVSTSNGDIGSGNFLDAVSITGLQATVSLSPVAASGPENISTANLPRLRINGAITTPQTVQINISPASTATRGTDYTTSPATGPITVTIPVGNYNGSDSMAISLAPYIQILPDAIYPEPDEIIIMSLQNPSSGIVLPSGNACGLGETISTYTITDVCPTFTVTPSATSLTTCSGDAVAINYTTAPTGGQVQWIRQPGNVMGGENVLEYLTNTTTGPQTYTYTATVFTVSGCPSTTAVTTVTVNPRPVITPSECVQTVCADQPYAINFATSIPASVNWRLVSPTPPAPQSGTGNIAATAPSTPTSMTLVYEIWGVANGSNCASSDTIECRVIVSPSLAVTALASSATVCVGSPLSLSASVAQAGTYTYSWTGPNGYASTVANPTVSATAAITQSGTYTVVVTDAAGCSGTATVPVVVNNCCDLLASVASAPVTNCTATTGGLVITYTGSQTYQYNLNGGTFQALGASPFTVSNLAPGSYTVVIQAVGDPTCTTTLTGAVEINAIGLIATSNSPQCTGNTVTLQALVNDGVSGTYQWSGPNGFVGTGSPISIPNATTLVNGTYVVTITDATGCSATATTDVLVTNQPSLTLTSGASPTICSGQSTTLSVAGSGGATVTWSNTFGQTGIGPNIVLSGIQNVSSQPQSITYVVEASAGTCSDQMIFVLTINPAPVLQVVPSAAVYCDIENVLLTANASSPSATINWTRSPATPTPPAASGSGTGTVTVQQILPAADYTYTFTATGANGCSSQPYSVPVRVQQ
ncbi:hypothetical protein [Larkinella harenae]